MFYLVIIFFPITTLNPRSNFENITKKKLNSSK